MSAITGAAAPGLRRRIGSHLRVPMFRDGYALVLSGMITAVLGAAYWVVAAHSYSAEDVGLNSAAISAMMLIAGIAQLNLSSALIRFVPVAGRSSRRLILGSYLTSIAVAAVLGVVFLLGFRPLVPSLGFVDEQAGLSALFVGSTVAWCVFVLQDGALTGLRRAVWVPAENAAFSVIKLVLLVAFAAAFPRHGIFASWALASVATLVPVTVLVFGLLVPRHAAASSEIAEPPSLRELSRFVGPDYLGALGWLAAVTVIPLVITERIGPTQNAYYALAWVIVIPIFFVSSAMGSSLVVSGVSAPDELPRYLRRMLGHTALLVLPMVAVVELAAPYLLRIFGEAYSEHGTTVLRLLALATVPHIVIALAVNAARVQRRMRAVVAIQVAECGVILELTWVLLGGYGVNGAGWAWLFGQTIVAAAVALWAIPGLGVTDRVIPAVGRWRAAVEGRWTLHRLRPLLDDVLDDRGERRLLAPPASDTLVVRAGDLAVKVAHTEAGGRSLLREIDALAALAADARLEDWRRLLPAVVDAGRVDGHVYLVQQLVGGRPAGVDSLGAAATAIGELHRLTAEQRTVGADLLDCWVDRPLRALDGLEGVERVRSRLHESLEGRTLPVGWIHGDFSPRNVLVDSGRVCGIVDWDQAIPDGLPVLDLIQFMLASRPGELGTAIGSFRPTAAEEDVLVDQSLELDTAVLLCWLHHVAANLEKSGRYGASRRWLGANVKAVLEEVAR
jgi:O-antigen/teichoic acid export membrane protein